MRTVVGRLGPGGYVSTDTAAGPDTSRSRLGEMLAARQAPGLSGTDRSFMQGRMNNEDLGNLTPGRRSFLLAQARAGGVDINGRTYMPELARPGLGAKDPEAWVSGRDDVLAVCRTRGIGVEGAVNVAAPETAPYEPGPYRVADDLVEERVQNRLAEQGVKKIKPSALQEMREAVRDEISPST